ncbi:restriction endonuclease subunit S [Lacticaseibacillus paracasei]|uniref:restriction endonuclease subunit S n=1 Tax=Lacticaseibacillus paracasei TaxID=1597 RepID=UPI001EEE64B2|nr:restriction endonuclease subunit S [Lacticaseibacillus paracasei]
MKDNQAKYPQLRFKGFTNPWEKRKLGKWFAERTERSGEGEMLSVTISSGVVRANSLDRKDNSSTDKSNYKVVHIGDIAYNSMRMWQAASGVSNYDGIVSPAYTVLVPAAEVSSVFFGYQFKQTKMKQIFQRNSQGLTSDTWNLKYPLLAKIKTSAPQKTEQVKIGTFFATLDHLIAVNQRKLAKLKELKQGYLQKLFPRNGSKFPQLRFAGFADAWEERKLGDLATSFEYGLNASAKEFDGIHKYIRITDIDDSSRKFDHESLTSPDIDLSSADNYKLQYGDILFARTGASVGKAYIYSDSDGLVYYAGFLIRARIKSGVDSNFIFQHTLTSSYENFIRVTSQRSGQPGVNAKEYSIFEISVPSYEEQQRIGSFFKQLDNTIALHQRKLEKLQELKKGYLQKMFC